MTTVSEAFEVPQRTVGPLPAGFEGAGARARVRARLAVTQRGGKVGALARVVASDVAGAWPWRGAPPTLADLWARRIPDLDDVPGSSQALRIGWAVFNHLALAWTAALLVPAWIGQHPARLALAAIVAAPFIVMWIS